MSDPPTRRDDDEHSERTRQGAPSSSLLRFESLAPGRVFANRYEIVGRLGSGGSGEVFEARDRLAGASVALKVLFPGRDDARLERLRRELEVVRGLQHPSIVRVWDVGEADGLIFVVSELLSGETLAARLERERPLPAEAAERILRGILEGLAVAHAHGIVHRDVKPANVFLAREGAADERVVLLDFGLARRRGRSGLTTVGRFVGTPEYASPEQIEGREEVTPATDLYSCGVTAWEMLAGKPPFTGDSDIAILTAHLDREPRDVARALGHARPALRALVLRLLRKAPETRPADASEALAALERSKVATRWSLIRESLGRRSVRRSARRLSLAAVVPLALLVWGLQPASVEATPDGGLKWTTRVGLSYERDPLEGRVAVASLTRGALPGWRTTWTASVDEESTTLHRMTTPLSRPVRLEGGESVLRTHAKIYPDVDQPFRPVFLVDISEDARDEEALAVLVSMQQPSYPTALVLYRDAPRLMSRFLHPGHVGEIVPFRPSPEAPLHVLVEAFNNRLGVPVGLFALPATDIAQGQAPPFEANVQRLRDAAAWYLPVDGVSHPRSMRVDLSVDPPRLERQGREPFAIDLGRGVPLDERARDGLSEDAWIAVRERLWDTLFRAARFSQAGSPSEGAALLDAFADSHVAPEHFVRIARYRAAVEHLASAREIAPREAYRASLEAIRRVTALSDVPSRFDLMEAEMCVRLGDDEGLARALDRMEGRERQPDQSLLTYLLDWKLGMPRGPGRAWTFGLDASNRKRDSWGLLADMLEAYRLGRQDDVAGQISHLYEHLEPWDLHHYVVARAALDAHPPDPRAALAALDALEGAVSEGTPIPAASARLKARALLGDDALRAETLAAMIEEVNALEEASVTDLSSLAMLAWAYADASTAAAALGEAELAERMERALQASPFRPIAERAIR